MSNIINLLASNTYPGRGIVIGRTANDSSNVIAYFIMGRSENSRNRVFVEVGDGIQTKAFDESKLTDPSLVIYAPVRTIEGATIVTNGDQTDTIYDALTAGNSFESALFTRTFEPDPPIFTPRISGISFPCGGYRLSILKSANGNSDSCRRQFFDYQNPVAGQGHFIHTYKCDGDPVPSFEGEPCEVTIGNCIDELTDTIWKSLNADNKVSLFTRFINRETGEIQTRIVNKHV